MTIGITTFEPKKPADIILDANGYHNLLRTHHGTTAVEQKYDGYGIIVDNQGSGVRLYSLNKREWDPRCFPELARDFKKLPNGLYIGEIVGDQRRCASNREEFTAVEQRKPFDTYGAERSRRATTFPLELRLYDVITISGKQTYERPGEERRTALENAIAGRQHILASDRALITEPDKLREIVQSYFADGREGVVCKDLTTPYLFGSRTKDWVRVKRALTVDLVALGIYQTEARLAQGWAASNVLVGTYNPATQLYEMMCKVTAPSDKLARTLTDKLDGNLAHTWTSDKPYNWQHRNGSDATIVPSIARSEALLKSAALVRKIPYLHVNDPSKSIVLEVECLNVSSSANGWGSLRENGRAYSLRQPRLLRIRYDKTVQEATARERLLELHA